jgi:glycine/D-amino acid oxidase-like deaminating enzyme
VGGQWVSCLNDDGYRVEHDTGVFEAHNVIIATGPRLAAGLESRLSLTSWTRA